MRTRFFTTRKARAVTVKKTMPAAANFPLANFAGTGEMHSAPARAKITLRAKADDEVFLSRCESELGFALPSVVGQSAEGGKPPATAMRLGPDEWMLWSEDGAREEWLRRLEKAAAESEFAAVVDVSDYYAVICLRGARARGILSAGCPLDFSAMRPGKCAQSHYAQAAVLILQCGEDAFDVQTRISFAPYLWRYFQTAAAPLL